MRTLMRGLRNTLFMPLSLLLLLLLLLLLIHLHVLKI
jgi:hypothetical protein